MCTTLCEMPTETTLLLYKCRLFDQNEWHKGHSDSEIYDARKKKIKKEEKPHGHNNLSS